MEDSLFWVHFHKDGQDQSVTERACHLVSVEARARILRQYHGQDVTIIHYIECTGSTAVIDWKKQFRLGRPLFKRLKERLYRFNARFCHLKGPYEEWAERIEEMDGSNDEKMKVLVKAASHLHKEKRVKNRNSWDSDELIDSFKEILEFTDMLDGNRSRCLLDSAQMSILGLHNAKIVNVIPEDYEDLLHRLQSANMVYTNDSVAYFKTDLHVHNNYRLLNNDSPYAPSTNDLVIKSGREFVKENMIAIMATLMLCAPVNAGIGLPKSVLVLDSELYSEKSKNPVEAASLKQLVEQMSVCDMRLACLFSGNFTVDFCDPDLKNFVSDLKQALGSFYKKRNVLKKKGCELSLNVDACDIETLRILKEGKNSIDASLKNWNTKQAIIDFHLLVKHALDCNLENQLVLDKWTRFLKRMIRSFGLEDYVITESRAVVLKKKDLRGFVKSLKNLQWRILSEVNGGGCRPKDFLWIALDMKDDIGMGIQIENREPTKEEKQKYPKLPDYLDSNVSMNIQRHGRKFEIIKCRAKSLRSIQKEYQ